MTTLSALRVVKSTSKLSLSHFSYTFLCARGTGAEEMCVRFCVSRPFRRRAWALSGIVLLLGLQSVLQPSAAFAQLSTADHLAEPGFWPTRSGASRSEYVGAAQCASCHPQQVASQKKTAMAQTTVHTSASPILASHPEMNFAIGRYHYEIKTHSQQSVYSVTDGTRTLTASLLWAFGNGRVGQSYLFKNPDGKFYEAQSRGAVSVRVPSVTE